MQVAGDVTRSTQLVFAEAEDVMECYQVEGAVEEAVEEAVEGVILGPHLELGVGGVVVDVLSFCMSGTQQVHGHKCKR